jgi:hypothetical protein
LDPLVQNVAFREPLDLGTGGKRSFREMSFVKQQFSAVARGCNQVTADQAAEIA